MAAPVLVPSVPDAVINPAKQAMDKIIGTISPYGTKEPISYSSFVGAPAQAAIPTTPVTTGGASQSGPVFDPQADLDKELAALRETNKQMMANLGLGGTPTGGDALAGTASAAATAPVPTDWSHRVSTTAWLAGQPGPSTHWAPADVAQKYVAAVDDVNARYNASLANIGKAPNIYGRRTA